MLTILVALISLLSNSKPFCWTQRKIFWRM